MFRSRLKVIHYFIHIESWLVVALTTSQPKQSIWPKLGQPTTTWLSAMGIQQHSVVGYLIPLDFDAQIEIMTDSESIFSKESENGW